MYACLFPLLWLRGPGGWDQAMSEAGSGAWPGEGPKSMLLGSGTSWAGVQGGPGELGEAMGLISSSRQASLEPAPKATWKVGPLGGPTRLKRLPAAVCALGWEWGPVSAAESPGKKAPSPFPHPRSCP